MDDTLFAQCEREPLHLSGAIQAHGTLLVADQDLIVTHLAANADEFLPESPSIGAPLSPSLAEVAQKLGATPGTTIRHPALLEGPGGWLDVALTRNSSRGLTLEFTPHAVWDGDRNLPHYDVPESPAALEKLQQTLVDRVAELSGFQRVMYYLFREDGDGEVVAESRLGGAYGTYLGLRYPASDVPHIARQLYLRNPWRLIPDAAADPVPIIRLPGGAPPDLSHSDLRSASPVHRLYLANMGVRASLSFPLIKADSLIGLIACHHDSPRPLSSLLLESCSQEVRSHSLAVSAFHVQQRMLTIENFVAKFTTIKEMLERNPSFITDWPIFAQWLVREFRADGAWFFLAGASADFGLVPPCEAREIIHQRLLSSGKPAPWFIGSLIRQFPDLSCAPAAGLLGIVVNLPSTREKLTIFISRQEHAHEVAWGGNPEKPVQHGPGDTIAPRQSFDKWIEKRTGYCRPWEKEERLLAMTLGTLLQKVPFGEGGNAMENTK